MARRDDDRQDGPDDAIPDEGRPHDAAYWDEIWRGMDHEPPASSVLDEVAHLLPLDGRALDVAGGPGGNALWLGLRGLDVTLVDISRAALDRARRNAMNAALLVETVQADLERDPLPPGPWDLILNAWYIDRRLWPVYPYMLAPGGVLVLCHPTTRNLDRHPRPSRRYLAEPGELAEAQPMLETLHYAEGWTREGRHEARLVARRTGW